MDTNQITLPDIAWPAAPGLASFAVFASTQDDLICAQQTGALAPGANNTYTPGSITVFRFRDWSLLIVHLTQGSDCIDLAALQALCIRTFQVTGGTGRFQGASGTVTLTETVVPVLADASNNPVFFVVTGGITGMVSNVATEEESQNVRQ